ncbi:MAG: DUF1853 family protein [Pseudomonadota bacterium]
MPEAAAPWLSYQHPAVRDLVWLLASAPLMASGESAYWPSASDYLALHARHEPWLRALDAEPQPLLTWLSQTRDHRLGRYAEDLLGFWLASPSNIEFALVAEHVALRTHGITLGEFDFLVRERISGQLWHIELALKFYLGTPDQQWLGPNRQDSLARKLKHLIQQQLPLLQTPAGQTWLHSQGLETPRPWAWIKGRLFSPYNSEADTSTPQWFTPNQLRSFAQARGHDWHTLAKAHWLAPGSSTPSQHAPFNVETDLPSIATQALIAFQGQQEVLRAFVVGNDWCDAPISSLCNTAADER